MLNRWSHVFRVGVGETKELVLVQVHDDELVCWRQVRWHLGELLVKVTGVTTVSLQTEFMERGSEGVKGDELMVERGMDCDGERKRRTVKDQRLDCLYSALSIPHFSLSLKCENCIFL